MKKEYIAFTANSYAISSTKEKALQELKNYLKRNKILPSVNKVGIVDITELPDDAKFNYETWKFTGYFDNKEIDFPVKVIYVDWNKKNEIVTESKKIKLSELKEIVKKVIKEESEPNQLKESWEGVDRDLETSLFEYGFVARQNDNRDYDDEWFVLYDIGENRFDTGHIRESELDNIVLGKEWADNDDVQSFLEFTGSSKEDWLKSPFVNKLSNLLSYFGYQNLMGTSYGGFSKDDAEQMLMEESYKPKTKKIKLKEFKELVKNVIKDEYQRK